MKYYYEDSAFQLLKFNLYQNKTRVKMLFNAMIDHRLWSYVEPIRLNLALGLSHNQVTSRWPS